MIGYDSVTNYDFFQETKGSLAFSYAHKLPLNFFDINHSLWLHEVR